MYSGLHHHCTMAAVWVFSWKLAPVNKKKKNKQLLTFTVSHQYALWESIRPESILTCWSSLKYLKTKLIFMNLEQFVKFFVPRGRATLNMVPCPDAKFGIQSETS